MIIPFYYIEDTWCYLEISIKYNKIYWVDWNVVYDKDGFEITDKNIIDLHHFSNEKNILSIDNNQYCYYNATNKKIYQFQPNYNIYCIYGINSFDRISSLKESYPEYLYFLEYTSESKP